MRSATVRIVRRDGAVLTAKATVDAEGRYRVVVPAGVYDISATAPGFAVTLKGSTAAHEGETKTVDLTLAMT
jgi:hypothetical protein